MASQWHLSGRQMPTYSFFAFLLAAITPTAANTFPYIPTRLYASSLSQTQLIYQLNPAVSPSEPGNLVAINASAPFDVSHPPITTLTPSLPFVDGTTATAFTSSLDPSGSLNVLVGDCVAGAVGASLWTFRPFIQGTRIQGSWIRQAINSRAISTTASQVGVNYLASSVSFTPTPQQNASIYTFAGMCPFANSTDQDWISAAAYSNQLLILDHNQATEYDFELGSGRGQPISEAGFSITPLMPTSSNASDGTQSTSQNFLLLGGHTQDAFINMSQVALFSLPQASWTFLPVISDGSKTDLRLRQAEQDTDPRSGHTAVLSTDGSKVIMFGGWVGDISTPADPQLAILNVGEGYGGTHAWSWTVPPSVPSLAGGASGLYGHGATMLDGDVMMVAGGWMIPTSATKSKRAASPAANTQTLLLNVTSGRWIQNYTPLPIASTSTIASTDNGGLLATRPQKIGLGVGLTFGILAVVVAALVGWFISKRFKRQLRAREEELREKEIDDLHRLNGQYQPTVSAYYQDTESYRRPTAIWDGRDKTGSSSSAEPNVWRNESIREAERSGVDIDIPSPHRGLRRSMASRQMHSGRGFDEKRVSLGSGIIHPIQETEEEDGHQETVVSPSEMLEDPFQDPEHGQQPTGPGDAPDASMAPDGSSPDQTISASEEKTRQTAQWVADWAAETGRVSPDKSERTQSNLSDHSSISQLTAYTHVSSTSSSARSRPISTPSPDHILLPQSRRALRLLPAALNPLSTASSGSPTSPSRSRLSLTSTPRPPNTADSFRTAATTFATLQSESDALLGPARPGQARFQPSTQGPVSTKPSAAFDPYAPDDGPTFILGHRNDAYKAPTGKVGSWVGSVRRAVANASRSASLTSTGIANAAKQRTMAQVGPSGDGLGGLNVYDVRGGRSEESPASSPTKKGGVTRDEFAKGFEHEGMRRSASEGATAFLVKRQGAKDWGWEGEGSSGEGSTTGGAEGKGKERSQSMGMGMRPSWTRPEGEGEGGEEEEEEEWDIEKAVEARNVQVMFSVPKERLRVVNADVDVASLRSGRSISGGRQMERGRSEDVDHLQETRSREG